MVSFCRFHIVHCEASQVLELITSDKTRSGLIYHSIDRSIYLRMPHNVMARVAVNFCTEIEGELTVNMHYYTISENKSSNLQDDWCLCKQFYTYKYLTIMIIIYQALQDKLKSVYIKIYCRVLLEWANLQ